MAAEQKTNRTLLAGIFIIGIIVIFYIFQNDQGKYDSFAKCLTQKGVKFYGTFWCPHCANQKALFGKSLKYVNYIECSTPDGKGQIQQCIDAEIKSYPTWIFPDGSRKSGELSLLELGTKSECKLEK
ncbi:hypothetical protein HZC07_03445 [Candidatus Micrarchaeota archaeon]|nr:hypothetical protein [Candidatus Micrarchaeota archaeon]